MPVIILRGCIRRHLVFPVGVECKLNACMLNRLLLQGYHWLVCYYLPPALGLDDVRDDATNTLAPNREFLHSSSFTSAVVLKKIENENFCGYKF
ncbi:hypothetical protein AB3S75_007032 [Citrus x aurantiifolia]